MKLCSYAAHCSGCSYWGILHSTQIRRKIDVLRQDWEKAGLPELPEIESRSLAEYGLRDRLDFRYEGGAFGLFERNRKEILDLKECLQLSPALHEWHQEFRGLLKDFLPRSIYKASIRLRVSPEGLRGVWLDLANEDVRDLFVEKSFLTKLLDVAQVEVGQRRKALVLKENAELSLEKTPRFAAWTRTWQGDQPVPLLSRIADFSQPGDQINRVLVNEVCSSLNDENLVVDWGTGSGNFALAALPKAKKLIALDVDRFALKGLRETLKQSPVAGIDRLEVREADFHRVGVLSAIEKEIESREPMTWIVDPPRSGAGVLFYELPKQLQKVVSVSCYMESFIQDSFELSKQGFQLQKLVQVEQFPQTPHTEWVSVWVRP